MSEVEPTTEEAFAAMVSRLLFFDHVARVTGYPGQAILLRMLLLDLAAIHKSLKTSGSTAPMNKDRQRAYQKRGDVRMEVYITRDAYDTLERLCARHRLNKRQIIERLLLGERLVVDVGPLAEREGLSEPEVEALRALDRNAA